MKTEDTAAATPIRVRIAPSPTGDPHVGTAYIGLINFLYARQRGGKFVLRIEDTDRARFVATSEQMIFDALHWLGLTWDEGPDVGGPYGPYRQSERTEIYREHVEILLSNGTAYRSFETAEELEALRQRQIASKLPPRYDGAHRDLTQAQIDAYLSEGRPYVVRMKVPAGSTTFRDELRGDITFEHSNVDDQVLMKSDGFPTYHLANVVDDHLMRITDVIRAEEWISSTPKHVLLYQAFGWQFPRFWHMPLLRNLDKSKISKRKNPVSLVYYRQAGFLPEAVINFLGLMGGGMPSPTPVEVVNGAKETEIFSLDEMIQRFEVPNIRLGGPVFDLTKLRWLNSEYLRALTPDAFFTALRDTILSDQYLREVSTLIQTRIETLGQFGDLTAFLFQDNVLPPPEVWVPKKRTPEETLLFAADQLALLETTKWTTQCIDAALRQLSMSIEEAFIASIQNESTQKSYRSAIQFFIQNVMEIHGSNLSINDEHIKQMQTALRNWGHSESTVASYSSAIEGLRKYKAEKPSWSIKENFMLLRAILSGSTMSPPLLESMVVFGKARTLDRLRRFLETQKKLATGKR
ncbi:glutamate--tRNA ligase [Granulicella sp. dw_53]|uniref:glutamate--tRNA ligase n=1 Tax=Granulicella sp. dw_53 TaxID=2719792 RepID=UPI002101F386|nr:glutamate--tRNA ligase [Granulicella sp. dw_53]